MTTPQIDAFIRIQQARLARLNSRLAEAQLSGDIEQIEALEAKIDETETTLALLQQIGD